MKKHEHWAIANRRKGESVAHWFRRCHEAYLDRWRKEKMLRGEWLTRDEYVHRKDQKK